MMQLAGWGSGGKEDGKENRGCRDDAVGGGCNELMLRSYLWEQ